MVNDFLFLDINFVHGPLPNLHSAIVWTGESFNNYMYITWVQEFLITRGGTEVALEDLKMWSRI